ncbi:hypothetical protein [Kordiimonas sp.]|uniref:hypothetical protein n=1 Tax=Kordiimonas sp. TaxID=1970157 RepID=UPI003A9033EE
MTLTQKRLTPDEFAALEHQVLWSRRYALEVIERLETLPADVKTLYQDLFANALTKITLPDLPMAAAASTDEADRMLVECDDNIPLSIVVTTRNDTHTERMEERTQAFIDSVYHVAETVGRRVELVIVEWNPPTDRPSLRDGYRFPRTHDYVNTVIYTVGEEVHEQFDMADFTPLYQMIAKNVGIRRARGKFILATNIDVLFSAPLFEAMTAPDLAAGALYRSHRCDINRNVLDLPDINAITEAADERVLRIHFQEGPLEPGEARRQREQHVEDDFIASQFAERRDAQGRPVIYNVASCYVGWDSLPALHYQQCGDFQLMHRDDWLKVRGYMELDGFIFHLDSLLAIVCHAAGMKEVVFPDDCRHYHIDHTTGVEIEPGRYRTNSGKLVAHLSIIELYGLYRYMEAKDDYCLYNDTAWGCGAADVKADLVTTTPWAAALPVPARLDRQSVIACHFKNVEALQNRENLMTNDKLRTMFAGLMRYLSARHRGRKIWIWGAGGRGRHLLHYLLGHDLQVAGFIETAPSGLKTVDGFPVQSPDNLQFEEGHFVLVASLFAGEIYKSLLALDAREGEHFLITP